MIRKKSKSNQVTKSSKITDDIITLYTAPELQDPENDSEDDTQAKVAEFDEDYESDDVEQQLSEFRKKNLVILSDVDKKYRGSLVSRRDLVDSDDAENSEDDQDDAMVESASESNEGNTENSDSDNQSSALSDEEKESNDDEDNESENNEKEELGDEDSNFDEYGSDNEEESKNYDQENQCNKTSLFPKSNDSTSNVQKGLCVQNQLKLWEKCLEMRIHSQKILNVSNSLPSSSLFERFISNDKSFKDEADKTVANISELLDKMVELQTTLVSR